MTITIQMPRTADLEDQDRACLRALYEAAGDYEDQPSQHCLPVDGTCKWATEDEGLTAWETAESSGLLWLTANPACGKSVFTNGYIKKVKEVRPDTLVCSFFFKQNGAHQALSALLHQILTKYPIATSYAREEFAAKGPSFASSTRTLWKILRDICRQFIPANAPILLVLDALDQCEESSRSVLIRELLSTFPGDGEAEAPSPLLKVLVTSRPTAGVELAFRPPCEMTRVRGEDKTDLLLKDIKRVINFRIGQLGSKKMLKRDSGDTLRSMLQIYADGSFLLVDAVFKLLAERGSYGESGVKAAVDDAKRSLNELYERALSTTSRGSRGLFQCLLAANGQLTLGEINVALALRTENFSFRSLEPNLEPDIDYTVKCLGGSFIRVAGGKVSFVHETARWFLQEREAPGEDSLDNASCHLTMANRCLRFLTDFHEPKEEHSFSTPLQKPPLDDFLNYAVRNWYRHTRSAGAHDEVDPAHNESPEIVKLWDSIRLLCDPDRGYLSLWWPAFVSGGNGDKDGDKATFTRKGSSWYFTAPGKDPRREYLLHRAASKRNTTVLHALLVAAPCQLPITDKNEEDQDVLCVAVEDRSHSVISWILEHFADAPLRREAALASALSQGYNSIVLTLLCSERRVQEKYLKSYVPASTLNMDPGILELLANNLSFVCLWGRSRIVEALIKDGADVNQKSGGMSPLLAAVFSGNPALVNTLLDHGADPDELSYPEEGFLDPEHVITKKDMDAPCGDMTTGGINSFWQLLWKYLGADAFGITPLAVAAQSNQLGMAHNLRKRGLANNTITLAIRRAFPNSTAHANPSTEMREIALRNLYFLKDAQGLGRKIFHEVICNGPVAVLNELIGYGCLELPPDAQTRTPLHVAAESGNVETTEVLLREATHSMLWSRDAGNLTCLRVALRAGNADVAMKIHEADRALARLTTERRTMLQDAVHGGVKKGAKVVDCVLGLIVDGALIVGETIDAKDGEGRTALHHVVLATKEWEPSSEDAKCGAVDVVRALVIGGAEYNLVDKLHLSPLAFVSEAVADAKSQDPPIDGRVLAALVELETTLTRVPFWGDNRLDAGAIRGNYEQLLKDKGERQDAEVGDNWMFDSEEDCDDFEEGDDEIDGDD